MRRNETRLLRWTHPIHCVPPLFKGYVYIAQGEFTLQLMNSFGNRMAIKLKPYSTWRVKEEEEVMSESGCGWYGNLIKDRVMFIFEPRQRLAFVFVLHFTDL